MNFISEDKKTINLPVPLGTTVYRFVTSCNDACLFQEEDFNKISPKIEDDRCSKDMPCHTKLHSIDKVEAQLSNLDKILRDWKITIFKSEVEAKEAGDKLVNLHKQELLRLGLKIE